VKHDARLFSVLALSLLVGGCGGKKKSDPAAGSGAGSAAPPAAPAAAKVPPGAEPWPLAPQEATSSEGGATLTVKGDLPTGWEQRPSAGRIRWMSPPIGDVRYGSLEIGPRLSATSPQAAASEPFASDYQLVDGPRELAPGRWSRVAIEPASESTPGYVQFRAEVYWAVGAATVSCAGRVVGAKAKPDAWQRVLDLCKAVEVTLTYP
jgi:hypothetical protein